MNARWYAGLTFLSAFLLFLVQPLIAKAILPWFGGAASVWTTSMLFFQVALVAGYALADGLARLQPRRQTIVHVALLALSLVALPIIPGDAWKPGGSESPLWWIVALLAATVGAPYLLLASTSPLVQEWFRRDRATVPHALYAWSNAGALGALVAYPLIAEPLLSVREQAWSWSLLYLGWVTALGWTTYARSGPAQVTAPVSIPGEMPDGPGLGTSAWWLALSMCGSGLLLAITNDLSLNLPAAPFLWIAPLALYLGSFILAFSGRYRPGPARIFVLVALVSLAAVSAVENPPLWTQVLSDLAVLFAVCLHCHGELHRSSPSRGSVTAFYLCIAIGGALGGILVAVIAPATLKDFWELPGLLLAGGLLVAAALFRDRRSRRVGPLRWIAVAVALWVTMSGVITPKLLLNRKVRLMERNFYGASAVFEDLNGEDPMRRLRHGEILHGTQFMEPARRLEPTAYYARGSGIDIAISQHPRRLAGQPLNIGVVGLGVGTIAAYGLDRDSIRFYEIDAAVVDIARHYFTFLDFGPANTDVVLGDGRLSLEREMSQAERQHRLDVLVLDAFSSDAIPVHLLTEEAMHLYWTALKPDGILAVHASTRYVNLAPVMRHHVDAEEKTLLRVHEAGGGAAFESVWLLATDNRAFLDTIDVGRRTRLDLPGERAVRWTDGFSTLLGLVELRR